MGSVAEEHCWHQAAYGTAVRVLYVGDVPESGRPVLDPGLRLSPARTLEAALRSVQSAQYGAIVLDLSVPDSRTLTSIQELALAAPRTAIIVLAGVDDEVLAIEACRQGAQDYLVKSRSNPMLLSRAIRYAVARKGYEAVLTQRAHFDSLTGLVNRALFHDRLRHALARATRADRQAALLFIDLDNFKVINDGFGHNIGDEVLRAVGEALGASVRQTDTVARLGGDEFTVLLEPLEHAGQAHIVAKKILRALDAPFPTSAGPMKITASIGVALFPEHASKVEALIQCADATMLFAKRCGGNRFRLSRRPE
jgi:diguanylate cyclase (GGDEF)-like protein